MGEDTSDIIKKFSSMLNSENIPDNIKNILGNMNNTASTENTNNDESPNSNNKNNINITPEMLNTFSSLINSSNNKNKDNSKSNGNENNFNIDFETILKMKNIFEKINSTDDPRSNLLLSLKPYLKESRQNKVEQYIKLFNMSKVVEAINKSSGGDNTK